MATAPLPTSPHKHKSAAQVGPPAPHGLTIDNDGLLDLVVLRYMQWDFEDIECGLQAGGIRSYCHPDLFKPVSMMVYHNDGKGKFTEVAHKTGLDKPGKELGIAIADFDHDGWMDIVVANDSMPEFLFHNKKDGTFEDVGLTSGMALDGERRYIRRDGRRLCRLR